MDTHIRALYALAAVAGAQVLGYFDYRIYYLPVFCLIWHALRVLGPTWTTNLEMQVGWYALKGGTTIARLGRPALACVTEPILRLLQARETGDKLYLVGANGETIETINIDSPLRPELIPKVQPEFVMYEWRSGDASKYAAHFIRFDTVEKAVASSLDFKLSEIKFLAPTVTIGPDKYDMSSELSTNNYYICGNRLFDKPFIAWYLDKNHSVRLGDRKYNVEFIDDKMQPQTLGETQVLLMQRDSYLIVPRETHAHDNTGLRERTSATSDRWAKENERLRAGKESLSKIKVDPNAVPSHKLYPWGQYY